MKNFYFFLLILFLTGCSNSPLQIGAMAEKNLIKTRLLKKGMTTKEVLKILDYPNKIKVKEKEGKKYLIWYYLTKGIGMSQTEFIDENFTPLVFKENILIGVGKRFYKNFFDVCATKEKIKYEKKSKYTDDKEEWPSNKHKIIDPQDYETEALLKKDIKKTEDVKKVNDK